MNLFPESNKINWNFLPPNSGDLSSSYFAKDPFDLEMDCVFDAERKAFSKFMTELMSDQEDGDYNKVALELVSAWAKNQTGMMINGERKALTKPKNIKDAFLNLKERHKKLVSILKKVWQQDKAPLTTQEEAYLIQHLKYNSDNFKDFISHCSLFDMCFHQSNKGVIQVAMDEFKKDIPFFMEWLNKENQLLSIVEKTSSSETEEKQTGLFYIVHKYPMAEAVLKNIPPECWTNEIVLSLGRWVLADTVPHSFIRDFAKKLEKCAPDKVKDYFDFLADVAKIYANRSKVDPDQFKHLSYKGLIDLFSCLKEEKIIQEATRFYQKFGSELMRGNEKNFANEEWDKVAKFLLKTPTGIHQLIQISMLPNNPLVWRLYGKNVLDKEDLKKVLDFAMKQDCRDFLLMKKPLHLSKNFPCYDQLKAFFKQKSSAQGTRFFKSFSWEGDSVEEQCKLLKDFVPSQAINVYFEQKLNLFNRWANAQNNYEILSFCYGENADTNPNPTCRLSLKDLKTLWLQPDADGKTPWHYLCEHKNKIFFQRRFKELPPLFLTACSMRDKNNRTPLDYAMENPKFMTNLLEKIPQVSDVLKTQGIQWSQESFAHKKEKPIEVQPASKTVKLAPSVPVAPIIDMTKVEQEEKDKINQSLKQALQKRQNLVLLGRERDFALTHSVLKEIESDTAYREDVISHLQKFLSTPIEQDFIVRGATRWKTFNGTKTNINEFSICPLSGHAESMPRFYCKKELFLRQNSECSITNRREVEKKKNKIQPLTIWVAVKKGDKRKQCADAQQAENIGFVNDGQPYDGNRTINNSPWYLLDLSGISAKIPTRIIGLKGGNPGL